MYNLDHINVSYLLFKIIASISSNIFDNVLLNTFGFVVNKGLYRVVQVINNFIVQRIYSCLFFNVVG